MSKCSVRGIIEHQGKYLLVRIKLADSFWCLPGGGIEPGEDVMSALTRELVEETGVAPKVGNLVYVHQIESDQGCTMPEFFFHVTNSQDYLNIDISKTTHGELELAEISFWDLQSVHLLPGFLKTELPELTSNNYTLPTRVKLSRLELQAIR